MHILFDSIWKAFYHLKITHRRFPTVTNWSNKLSYVKGHFVLEEKKIINSINLRATFPRIVYVKFYMFYKARHYDENENYEETINSLTYEC